MTAASRSAGARTHTRARVRGKPKKPMLSSFGAVLAGLGMASAVGAKPSECNHLWRQTIYPKGWGTIVTICAVCGDVLSEKALREADRDG